MATEKVESRTQHYTANGQAVTRIFVVTHDEANYPALYNLPILGTPWSYSRPDLTVTDIVVTPLPSSSTHSQITYTYSVAGQNWPARIPETVASLNQVFDFQMTPGISDAYWDYGTVDMESWEEIYGTWYKAGHSGDTPTTIPPRVREDSTIVMTITGNVNSWDWRVVSTKLGKVNSITFLPTYSGRYVTGTDGSAINVEAILINEGHDDIGQWLFAGFRAESIGRSPGLLGRPNYEITETFIWESWGWNTIYGVTGYNAYDTTSFYNLPRPVGHNVSIDMGLR